MPGFLIHSLWPRVRIYFFRQRLMDRTMKYFQTRSKDECNLTKIACWRRTSHNRDGVATHIAIKEIISSFKDHRSIKIIKSHIALDDQEFSSKLTTGNSIKKSSINLAQELQLLSTVCPLSSVCGKPSIGKVSPILVTLTSHSDSNFEPSNISFKENKWDGVD